MSAGHWIQHRGYRCSVYASSTGDCVLGSGASESSDSLRSRPLASDYDGTDIYVSMHTNGYQGDCRGSGCPNGTATYYDASSTHAPWAAVSLQLAQSVNSAVVDVIRTHYGDASWRDRGTPDAHGSFAETRIPDRAAVLIELSFHDSCDRDVDQADFGHLQACLSGDVTPQTDPACQGARMDADADVDQNDVALFLGCMTAPNIPGDPDCVEQPD